MTKKISLKIPNFIPANKKMPVLDLMHFNASGYLDYYKDIFLKKLEKYSFKDLVGIRNSDLEIELKEKIREFLKIKSKVNNKNIIFGFGSYGILERLAGKFLEKGLMIGEFPQFHFIPMEYVLAGGKYKGFQNKDFSFPKEKILEAIKKSSKLKAIYINNPSNPTGKLFDTKAIVQIIKKAEKNRTIVIVDEVYGDFLEVKSSVAGFVNQFNNLIVIRSFSKCFGLQNLRLGYMISNEKLITKYQNICAWNEINNIGAIAGITILENKNHLLRLKRQNIAFKKETISFLKNKFEIIPSNLCAPYLFLKSKENIDLEEYFRQRNIEVMGSKNYQILEKNFPINYVRIRVPVNQKDLKILKERLSVQ